MAKEKKATFTYTTLPSVREKAKNKAEKEGYSLSVKIDMMLREYIRTPKRKIGIGVPVQHMDGSIDFI